jgi:hypothetical protein
MRLAQAALAWRFSCYAVSEEARDVLAIGAQEVRFLDLAGVLAQAELEEGLAGLAELGGDLARGESRGFLWKS